MLLYSLKRIFFTQFGAPHAILRDEGSHFCNQLFRSLITKYWVKHKVTSPYHRQANRLGKVSNQEIKEIMVKRVNASRTDCSHNLDDALAY